MRVGDRSADVDGDDVGAVGGQPHRVRAALAACGPGYECHSPVQRAARCRHHCSFRRLASAGKHRSQANSRSGTCSTIRVADDRAGHAVAAAAASAQFGPDDGDDLDAGLAQQRVGVGVAVVGEDDAGFDGDEVVAAVPLLTLGVVVGAAGLHHPEFRQPQRRRDHLDERLRLVDHVDADVVVAGHQRERRDAVDDLGIDGDHIAVGKGEHRVEVHRGAKLRHSGDDHLLGGARCEQLGRDLGDGLARRALAHADEHDPVAGASTRRRPRAWPAPMLFGIAPPHRRRRRNRDGTRRSPSSAASRRVAPARTAG